MAITITKLTDNYADDVTSTDTSSVSPSSNKLQLLSVSSRRGDSVEPNTPTITGNGLTWELVDAIYFDTSSASRRKLFLFRALGSSPSSGVITIDFSGVTTSTVWSLNEVTGVDTSGTNGSAAIVRSATNKDESITTASFSVTLPTFSDPRNTTFGVMSKDDALAITPGSGFTELSETSNGFSSLLVQTQWKDTGDTSVDWTSGGNLLCGGIAVEIRPANDLSSSIPNTRFISGH